MVEQDDCRRGEWEPSFRLANGTSLDSPVKLSTRWGLMRLVVDEKVSVKAGEEPT